ncbi:bifunctional 5,10-methylene-tetrahydrofolate dehydrogenase/5,10-methylene-tetrahydrofolate cyclohydrolase, partial [Crocinitomicaceae bacterium]|nr:bifunctional 5,10-methylene-tetrahydrofolate dehydrogenase/5,10-methylene-tetrahydrofolate cyclohydrolase [Crocinitomicaceae bacterium]
MQRLNGKTTAEEIRAELKTAVTDRKQKGMKVPHLAAVLVGNDGGSMSYVGAKVKACDEIGFNSSLIQFDDSVSEEELLSKVEELNNNEEIDGFIVQLPLPKHINETKITDHISPNKDVDGFHPMNLGNMLLNLPGFLPATP